MDGPTGKTEVSWDVTRKKRGDRVALRRVHLTEQQSTVEYTQRKIPKQKSQYLGVWMPAKMPKIDHEKQLRNFEGENELNFKEGKYTSALA